MFNIDLNEPNLVNVSYVMFDKIYQTKQIIGEELIQPLVTIKKHKISTKYQNMFTYEEYKLFSGWKSTNNRLPKFVYPYDVVYEMNYINLSIGYENIQYFTSEGFVIYAVISSSSELYFNNAYCNNCKLNVQLVSELPEQLTNPHLSYEDSKFYNSDLLSMFEYNKIIKFTFTNLDQTSGKENYKIMLPVYLNSQKTDYITTLELNLSVVKFNGPTGD